jgi:hypothetical protein
MEINERSSMTTRTITPEEYAAHLVVLVRRDWDQGQIEGIGSWEALHSVCDANEYLIDADEFFGLPEDDFGTDERLDLANTAITLACKALGWKEKV